MQAYLSHFNEGYYAGVLRLFLRLHAIKKGVRYVIQINE
jgi:hypothetical protein